MAADTERVARTSEVIGETVLVRTRYAGQHLRVALVHDPDGNWEYDWPARDQVVAELVIAPGHRLVVADGGVRVERIDS